MRENLKPILIRIAAGDQDAFRQLFDAYAGKVRIFALKLTHAESMAEEIVQDVFMKIWLNRNVLVSIEYFPSYLYTIVRNHAFNMLKRLALEENAKVAFGKSQPERYFETEERVIFEECQQILNNAIDRLPPQQRLVYSLCHQEGLKYEEVAERLNISRLTVKTHMQQALRAIKSHFGNVIGLWVLVGWVLDAGYWMLDT